MMISLGRALWRWQILICLGPALLLADENRVVEDLITDADREHWAFRPLERPEVPSVEQEEGLKSEIDHFIIHRLEEQGLHLMPEATPETLIRRVTFDLTGLPPDPDAVREFVLEPTDERYATYVDRLLASSAYGERWAQHWLDLVRFGETDGFEHDETRDEAWRFRDWVITAFNQDMAYDRFVQLQLAGDEMEPKSDASEIATGFLLCGPDMPDINSQDERRHNVLNDITSTVGTAFLGLTMNCAQCHDHPYDPVSHADFYRLRAFFENSVYPAAGKQLGHIVSEPNQRPPRHFVYLRGDYRERGPEIAPWFLRIINPEHEPVPSLLETMRPNSSGRRAALAEWLTREDNQLFLRSSVNRIWQHHFGTPLAGTPNDLGVKGDPPTHPELLDWLATELPRQDWSLKQMHKLLVTSATYRQSSQPMDEQQWALAVEKDPRNELYSRMNRKRLSGEAIRDAMLVASDSLNPKPGGPSVRLPLPEEIQHTLLKKHQETTQDTTEYTRRSVYVFSRRNLGYPMFDVFDRPDRQTSCAIRNQSTTPTQSLTQLNSPFSRDMADGLAKSILDQVGMNPSAWIDAANWQVLGRAPTNQERDVVRRWLEAQMVDAGEAPPVVLSDYCLALFNTNAFLYVD